VNTWFTADLHLGHENILKYCPNRPFKSILEHDLAIIDEWNTKVQPKDHVYFLGDLTLDPNPEYVRDVIGLLTGTIHIVLGNHDRALKKIRKISPEGFRELGVTVLFMQPYKDIGYPRVKVDGKSIILNHHPLEEWPGMGQHGRGEGRSPAITGRWHLHGHSHTMARQIPARLDVGWDTANKILSWDDVQARIHKGCHAS